MLPTSAFEINRLTFNERQFAFVNAGGNGSCERSEHGWSVWVGHSLRLRSGWACPTRFLSYFVLIILYS